MERVLGLVRRSPAFIGMQVVVHDDHVAIVSPEQVEFGLGPVYDAVSGAPADQWADIVDDCLRRILGALTSGSPELDGPTDHFLDRVHARLRPVDGSPVDWRTYAREVAPGLLMVLSLDHPDRIAILNDNQVERHGYDRLLEAGLDNLCRHLPEAYAENEGVYVLSGDEYVASSVLIMPWIAEATTGSADLPYGVLVAVPNHTMLIFHVVQDNAGVAYALGEIAHLAAEYCDESTGLSPQVYWWQPGAGSMEPVAQLADDAIGVIGEDLVTHYSAGFADLLQHLPRV